MDTMTLLECITSLTLLIIAFVLEHLYDGPNDQRTRVRGPGRSRPGGRTLAH